jgi:hypothetical protein
VPTADTSTVVTRETAWLTTSGDGLPALLATAGGPFDIVQAYLPRLPVPGRKHCLFVIRQGFVEDRFASPRVMDRHGIELRIVWYTAGSSTVPLLETEQRHLDGAVEAVRARILGPLGDKTHGGSFLSAAEVPRTVEVRFEDPDVTFKQDASLRASILYFVDDFDFPG